MADAPTSIWKKEISLRRKPKKDRPQAEKQAESKQQAEPKPSFWKKEVSLRRRPKAAPEAVPATVRRPPLAEPPPPAPQDAVPPQAAVPVPQLEHSQPLGPVTPVEADPDEDTLTFDLDLPGENENPLPPAAESLPQVEAELETEIAPGPFPQSPAPPSLPPVYLPAEPRGPFALPAPGTTELHAAAEENVVADERQPAEQKKRLSRFGHKAGRAAAKEARAGRKTRKIVGLKIGASQLAAARVSNNGSAELLQVAREPLESGIVVAGELRDPESLAIALKAFFKKNKLPTRGIRLGLSNNRIGVRVFDIGGIDDPEQLRNAIRFRAQETLPIPIEEAVLDYQLLGESVDEDGAVTRRVLLVVAYRDLIDRYVTACRKAGLRLIGVDLEAFALLRALGKAPSEREGDRVGVVVVSVGHDRSTFAVSDGRVCEFARVLDWGGYSLNVAVARALDLTPLEAEPIKLALSLTDTAVVPQGLTTEQADAAREAVIRALEAFARDLVSSLRFYQSQPESLGIRELVLTGGTAELPGLAAELERLIGVYVRVGDPLGRVKVSRRMKQPDRMGSLAAAIGLGIED